MYFVFMTDPYTSFSKCEYFLSGASAEIQNVPI